MTAEHFTVVPSSAPCYTGGYLNIKSRYVSFDSNHTYFVVFEDENQKRYVVAANIFNVCCLVCAVPPVLKPTTASMILISVSLNGEFEQMLSSKFTFTPDPIDPLAAFLAKNANCLDCDISIIEKFSNSLMKIFDNALSMALISHAIEIDPSQHTPRLTLFHLVAYLGLEKTLNRLISTLPGCLELLDLKAPNGLSPADLADGEIGDKLTKLSQADIQSLNERDVPNCQLVYGYPLIEDATENSVQESIEKLQVYSEELINLSNAKENDGLYPETPPLGHISPLKESAENGRTFSNSLPNVSELGSLIDHLYNAVTATGGVDLNEQRLGHSRSYSDLQSEEEIVDREKTLEDAHSRRDSGNAVRRRSSLPPRQQDPHSSIILATSVSVEDDDKPNWSEWCHEHHPTLIDTMTSRQRKLQDAIWEFIRTEHHHLRILSLLHRVYRRPIKEEFKMDDKTLEILFPNLDQLVAEHNSFLAILRSRQKERLDRQIFVFSDLLLDQFTGEQGAAFSNLYAQFILHQYPAKKKYDELFSENKEFAAFVAKCKANEASQRMGIPECRLRITQRITQMPLLVQAICKYVTDDREKEEMNRALCAVRQVAGHVNEQLDRQTKRERLATIKSNFDVRSGCTFQGRKFGKSELFADGRQLRFYGTLQLRTSKGYKDVLCLLMTDVFVLLSESSGSDNNRYALYSSGNRQPVLSLRTIVVHSTIDGTKTKVIYVVNPGEEESNPAELYEFKCPNADNWREWMRQLKEGLVDAQMGLVSGMETSSQRSDVKSIFNELSGVQQQIEELCASKNALLRDAFAATTLDDIRPATRLAMEATGERVVSADQELRQLIEDIQRSFELADLSASRSKHGESISGSNSEFDLPDWRALTLTWLQTLHGILASITDLQSEVATQRQQLVDIRNHPSYQTKMEELREEDTRLVKLREALQYDREELIKKRVEINESLDVLNKERMKHMTKCEREVSVIEREKEELRAAKEKLAQQKEILQRQTDLNLQERAIVEEQKNKLKQQQQQIQEHAHLHAQSFISDHASNSPLHHHQTSPSTMPSLANSRNANVHSSSSIPHHLASFSTTGGSSPSHLSTGSSSSNLHRGTSSMSSTSLTPNKSSSGLLLPSKLEEKRKK